MDTETIFKPLTEEKCRFRVVSAKHVAELQQELMSRFHGGEFDREFAEKYIPTFKFSPPEELKNAKSLVIVAIPRPPTRATFWWSGKKQSFTLPPTYTAYDETRIRIEHLISDAIGGEGYRIATPKLPLKLLAVRSGLAEYGRNNITYVEGMGSFQRLTAVYTDLPCEADSWQEPKTLRQCEGCSLCKNACPTGAISDERFLLKAEKCLTYHNEKEAKIPFPSWIKPEWHNCLVGCIRCQSVCPQNRLFLDKFGVEAEFDEEETRLMLAATPVGQISLGTVQKMKLLGLLDYINELPRNLSVLLR